MELHEAFEQILPQGHPSFGMPRALFLFALGSRFLMVEAGNPWAVLCLERLVLVDGRVSDNCRVVQVIRNHRGIPQDPRVEQVPFVDFMTDIVDLDRALGGAADDTLVAECFRNALSDDERQVALAKLQAVQSAPDYDMFAGVPSVEMAASEPVATFDQEDKSDKLTTALVGLGFKKAEVRKFVVELGDRTRTDDLHSLLREGLRALAA